MCFFHIFFKNRGWGGARRQEMQQGRPGQELGYGAGIWERGCVDADTPIWVGYGNTWRYGYRSMVWKCVGIHLQGCGMGIHGDMATGMEYANMWGYSYGPKAILPETGLKKHLNCPG